MRDEFEKQPSTDEVNSPLLVQALGWWTASEIVRRHPGSAVYPFRYHNGNTYLWIFIAGNTPLIDPADPSTCSLQESNGRVYVDLNRKDGGLATPKWKSMVAADRRDYPVRDLEIECGVTAPPVTPMTVNSVIGVRLIAGFLTRTALSHKGWLARPLSFESHPYGDRIELVDLVRQHGLAPPSGFREPLWRYWTLANGIDTSSEFVQLGELWSLDLAPELLVDVFTGQVWNTNQVSWDLMDAYDGVGRSMDRLISAVCPAAY